jgi:hypothetical protein
MLNKSLDCCTDFSYAAKFMYRVGSTLSKVPRPVVAIFVQFQRTAAMKQSVPIMDFLRDAFELNFPKFALRSSTTKLAISLSDNSGGQFDKVAFLPPLQAGEYSLLPLYADERWFTIRFEVTKHVEEGKKRMDIASCNPGMDYSYPKVLNSFIFT